MSTEFILAINPFHTRFWNLHRLCTGSPPVPVENGLIQVYMYHLDFRERDCIVVYVFIHHMSRGFYFREFCELGAIREFNNTRKYLPPIRPDAWMWLCIHATQYLHVQGKIATFAFWKWVIAPLLNGKFNHSRKCLEVPIRKIQWNLVITRSDITISSYNEVILLVPALHISLFFLPWYNEKPDITR